MIKTDYHTHTCFSDGNNTPEEMILKAIGLGMTEIGISDHSYTFFDESYCIQKDRIEAYYEELQRLKIKYRDRIKVLCGLELDYEAGYIPKGYDYIIGSVHYVKKDGRYYEVDGSPETLLKAVNEAFDGDFLLFAEYYFKSMENVVERTNCDVIGHFDLVSKFNQRHGFFDENDPRYVAAWQRAADKLLKYGKLFEINTGGIYRGFKTEPYPSLEMQEYIAGRKGRFIWSSDAHCTEAIMYQFPSDDASEPLTNTLIL